MSISRNSQKTVFSIGLLYFICTWIHGYMNFLNFVILCMCVCTCTCMYVPHSVSQAVTAACRSCRFTTTYFSEKDNDIMKCRQSFDAFLDGILFISTDFR